MFSSARRMCLSSIPECTELCTYALQGAAPNALSRVDHPRMIRYVDHLLPVDALKPRQGVFWGTWGSAFKVPSPCAAEASEPRRSGYGRDHGCA